jgi:predicted transcriptional regulator
MPISDAESVVMDVLWRSRVPMSAEDVVAALASSSDWREATIKTLLNRLLGKRAISATRDGKRYLYSARLKREDYVHTESKGLIDRLFGGRVAPLVAHFSEAGKLSKKDLAELKRLIEELDNDA